MTVTNTLPPDFFQELSAYWKEGCTYKKSEPLPDRQSLSSSSQWKEKGPIFLLRWKEGWDFEAIV